MLVLLVENDPEVLDSLIHRLSEFKIHVATTLRAAIGEVKSCRPDAVLFDLDMGGFAVLDAFIRVAPSVPIFCMTTKPSIEIGREAKRRCAVAIGKTDCNGSLGMLITSTVRPLTADMATAQRNIAALRLSAIHGAYAGQ